MFRRRLLSSTRWLPFFATLAIACLLARSGWAESLAIANPSFESPVYADGGYDFAFSPASQGTWGWAIGDGGFIYNPPAADYVGAGGQGSPLNVDGAQVGGVFGFGEYVISQNLAGPDAMLGNGDDPVLEPGTVYTLRLSIGQRAVGNTFGATWGGYDVQLRAGTEFGQVLLAQESDAVTPAPGTFVERTIVFECPTYDHPEAIGMPLVVLLRKTIVNSTATTEFDNVRLDAAKVSPLMNADFNEAGGIDGADLALWRMHFGDDCLDATHDRGNANSDDFVNGSDFLLWQRQLDGVAGMATPEPAAGTLAWLMLAIAFCRGGKR